MPENGTKEPWSITREKILLSLGILVVIAEFVNAEVLGRPYHYEFLFAGLALCGIGIIQGVDRK